MGVSISKSVLSIAERIKRLIFGSIRFRFTVLLISSGVLLVAGGSWREIIFLTIAELIDAKETIERWEQADLVAQITGILMIVTGVYLFIYFINKDIITENNEVTSAIIDCWTKEIPLNQNQLDWLKNNVEWAEEFWAITRRTEFSKRERLQMFKMIKV